MQIIVVGCGRMGSELAYRMSQRGQDVAVIALPDAPRENLPADFQGRVFEGDVTNYEVLHRAGIETCDALVAATNSDALNLVVAHAAAQKFHVKTVVARNYDPAYRYLYEMFDLQIVSATSWAAQRLEEMVYHGEVRAVFSAGNGEVEVYELAVGAEWDGHPLSEWMIADVIAVSVARAGRAHLPRPDWILKAGDVVHVSATLDGVESLRALVCRPREEK
ncbi:MAG: TrkA family potassium uptake protein [Anaerolinea sp.]|nr:TrkA family potassium uptake protein [Anaerolinea sp.]